MKYKRFKKIKYIFQPFYNYLFIKELRFEIVSDAQFYGISSSALGEIIA